MAGWFFKELGVGYVRRTSHIDEFFNNSTKVDAIVREAIQNSVDAKDHNQEIVMVRFRLSRTGLHLEKSLLEKLPEHLSSSGINVSSQLGSSGIPYLSIEDFNTTGLTGNPDQNNINSQDGDFYNFWWSDGVMKKGGKSGGRWGLGKYTFFASSQIKTFWGLTVREDNENKILMGRVLLKPHTVENVFYNSDGFFVTSDEFQPIVESDEINNFEKIFQLNRKKFNGLSIVIPFPLQEIDHDSILLAILDHYLYSIVTDKVRVNISEHIAGDSDKETILNKNNIIELLKSRNSENSSKYSEYYQLSRIFEQVPSTKIHCELSIENLSKPEITEKSFGEDLENLRRLFEDLTSKIVIKLRIPVIIYESSNHSYNSYYDIVITKLKDSDNFNSKVFCLRSGILVTDAININARGLVIMLIAEDEKIAKFLGDAENPSHTKWSSRTENFIETYSKGKSLLSFILESPGKILDLLRKSPTRRDMNLLEDVFYIDVERNVTTPRVSSSEVPVIKKNPRLLEINQTTDGFSVYLNDESSKLQGSEKIIFPFDCKIETAYVVRRGNPIKKYTDQDFDLSKKPIKVEIEGNGELIQKYNNTAIVRVDDYTFAFKASGFDKNRDLYVSAKIIKSGRESNANKEV